jgi:HSP20 family protein
MFGRDLDRMMQMWAELLGEIEMMPISAPQKNQLFPRRKIIANVEDRDEDVVLSADLPGVEKKDIELSVDHNSVAFKAKTEERDYDFHHGSEYELNPDEVKATFNNGVLDVVVKKVEGTQGKIIEIE